MSEKKHLSKQWLRERYFGDEMSVPEMAELVDVCPQTIYDAMDQRGIDRDASRYGYKSRVEYATYYLDDQGYPRWQAKGREDGERVTDNIHVHRLLAIAEHGVDAVIGKHVHHKNEVEWDNRPSNLELLSPGEHRTEHMTPETVDKMVRARGETPPTRADGGQPIDAEQQSLTGDTPRGQLTIDAAVKRDGGS